MIYPSIDYAINLLKAGPSSLEQFEIHHDTMTFIERVELSRILAAQNIPAPMIAHFDYTQQVWYSDFVVILPEKGPPFCRCTKPL